MFKKITINFTPQFNFIRIYNKENSKSTIYFYNKIYFFKLGLKEFVLNSDLNFITTYYKTDILYSNYDNKLFKKFLKSLDCYFFLKIKFKGKGYKIKYKKRKKLMKFYFNRSHKTLIKYKNIILKKNMKYKFILKSPNLEYLNYVGNLTKKVRPLNLFTSRGLRISRTIVGKRKGKKGSYI